MLIPRDEVIPLLRCPRTGAKLYRADDDNLGVVERSEIRYPIVNGCPILIEFEHSIFKKDNLVSRNAHSIVKRDTYRGFTRLVKRILSPPKSTTARNVRDLIELLIRGHKVPENLIVGGGSVGQGMAPFYERKDLRVVAFDVYASTQVQVVADAHCIPLPDNAFDCVIIQAVLEHVLDPRQVVSEIRRVLKPSGLVYAETPFMQQVHEGAYDFTRFTESGHRYLFRDFETIRSGASAGPGTQLLWSVDYFFRGIFRSRTVGRIAKLACFWLRWFDKIIPPAYAIDGASGVFFLGRKGELQVQPGDMVTYYKGAQF